MQRPRAGEILRRTAVLYSVLPDSVTLATHDRGAAVAALVSSFRRGTRVVSSVDRPQVPSSLLVLLLYGERGARAQYAQHLREAGFAITEAETGQQALEAVAVRPPDVIVADLDIPSIDGLAFCRRLRAEPRRARVPLVVLATRQAGGTPGLEGDEDELQSRLVKPCPPERLVAEVRYLVGMVEEKMRHDQAQVGKSRTRQTESGEPSALDHIRLEFTDLPGLRLTLAQAQRLWHTDRPEMEAQLAALVADGFLRLAASGHYERTGEPARPRMAKADLASRRAAPRRANGGPRS